MDWATIWTRRKHQTVLRYYNGGTEGRHQPSKREHFEHRKAFLIPLSGDSIIVDLLLRSFPKMNFQILKLTIMKLQ